MKKTERRYYVMQIFIALKLQKGHGHGLAHARIGDFQHFMLPKVFSSRHGDEYSRTLECCQGV